MLNRPETEGQVPQPGKLVLPAYTEGEYRRRSMPGDIGSPDKEPFVDAQNRAQIRPEHLIRQATKPPTEPLARLRYFWHKDPAYKVLMIAVGTVLIAGLLFVSLVSGAMPRNPNFFSLSSTTSQVPPTIVPRGTVDLHPTFPSPGGGRGSNTSSQPPAQSTPVLQPTADSPTAQPSPTPGGTLTVQITDIPHRVQNNSVVDVGVNTNEANVTVTLYVLYNAPPYRSFAGPGTTDGGGNASISWDVSVYKTGNARAMVVAIAKDQNGQQTQSQPVSVDIVGFSGD